jgi:hypothetical protein
MVSFVLTLQNKGKVKLYWEIVAQVVHNSESLHQQTFKLSLTSPLC